MMINRPFAPVLVALLLLPFMLDDLPSIDAVARSLHVSGATLFASILGVLLALVGIHNRRQRRHGIDTK